MLWRPDKAIEHRAWMTGEDANRVANLASGGVGVAHPVTSQMPTSGYTLVNGYCEITIANDTDPAAPLTMQLRIMGQAGGPSGELARGIPPPPYAGDGVYQLTVPTTSESLAMAVWLEVFFGNDGENVRSFDFSWRSWLVAGLRF